MIATSSPSASSHRRSRSIPLTRAITAALRRLGPSSAARSPAVVPVATSRVEPSGSLTVIWSLGMASTLVSCRHGSLPIQHLARRAAGRRMAGGLTTVAVGHRHLRDLGGQRDRLLRRVRVDVVLAGQLADLVHELVSQLPQHEVVVGAVAVALHRDWPAEADRARPERSGQLRVRWLDVSGALQADGHDRRASAQREPRGAGVAAMKLAVA